jgi:hypothetical protein
MPHFPGICDDPAKPELHGPLDVMRCTERRGMIAHARDPVDYSGVSRDHRLRTRGRIAKLHCELEDTRAQGDELHSRVAQR